MDLEVIIEAAVARAVAPLAAEIRALRSAQAARTGEWISRQAMAERLSVSVDTIDRRIRAGEMTARRTGRTVRVFDAPLATETEVARMAAAIVRPAGPDGGRRND